ncbi:MAG: hypothetical protein KGS72_27430 [Cyanobacteria bacterium REEB67]|nr:hypothetical protein [Cyanobacteria bacterium REEB67]
MQEEISHSTSSSSPLQRSDPPPDFAPRSLEEQKTRLWAMSFESTKQIVHCEKCGATNIVNRLTEAAAAVPVLRLDATPMPAQQHKDPLETAPRDKAVGKKLSREKKAIVGLAAISAGLAVALMASLGGRRQG